MSGSLILMLSLGLFSIFQLRYDSFILLYFVVIL